MPASNSPISNLRHTRLRPSCPIITSIHKVLLLFHPSLRLPLLLLLCMQCHHHHHHLTLRAPAQLAMSRCPRCRFTIRRRTRHGDSRFRVRRGVRRRRSQSRSRPLGSRRVEMTCFHLCRLRPRRRHLAAAAAVTIPTATAAVTVASKGVGATDVLQLMGRRPLRLTVTRDGEVFNLGLVSVRSLTKKDTFSYVVREPPCSSFLFIILFRQVCVFGCIFNVLLGPEKITNGYI
jgi:hypothetical protein